MMGIVMPETCRAGNKICNKKPLLRLVGILFPHITSINFLKNTQISNFMKILPLGAELFNADGQTDRHDEINSRSSQILRTRLNIT